VPSSSGSLVKWPRSGAPRPASDDNHTVPLQDVEDPAKPLRRSSRHVCWSSVLYSMAMKLFDLARLHAGGPAGAHLTVQAHAACFAVGRNHVPYLDALPRGMTVGESITNTAHARFWSESRPFFVGRAFYRFT
jgi:hypothetical protein